ncbi:hypothetical protein SprV_0802528000 [Sparganum proliferum]
MEQHPSPKIADSEILGQAIQECPQPSIHDLQRYHRPAHQVETNNDLDLPPTLPENIPALQKLSNWNTLSVMQYGTLAACVVTPYIGGFLGSPIVKRNMEWYRSLKRPPHAPPEWIFVPAWSILYGCMGTASYLVIREAGQQDVRFPIAVYGANLLLNFSWTPVFFGMHRLKTSVAIILATTFSAFGCHYLFQKVNPTAGLLMLPYVLWLCFASSVNIGTARLNSPPAEEKSA